MPDKDMLALLILAVYLAAIFAASMIGVHTGITREMIVPPLAKVGKWLVATIFLGSVVYACVHIGMFLASR